MKMDARTDPNEILLINGTGCVSELEAGKGLRSCRRGSIYENTNSIILVFEVRQRQQVLQWTQIQILDVSNESCAGNTSKFAELVAVVIGWQPRGKYNGYDSYKGLTSCSTRLTV